jgi:hypothetical protein
MVAVYLGLCLYMYVLTALHSTANLALAPERGINCNYVVHRQTVGCFCSGSTRDTIGGLVARILDPLGCPRPFSLALTMAVAGGLMLDDNLACCKNFFFACVS